MNTKPISVIFSKRVIRTATALLLGAIIFPGVSAGTQSTPNVLDCPAFNKLAGSQTNASLELQRCLDHAPSGASLEINPGTYWIATPILMERSVTLEPKDVPASAATCAGQDDKHCVTLIIDMVAYALSNANPDLLSPLLVTGNDVAIHHFVFYGVRGRNVEDDEAICNDKKKRGRSLGGGFHLTGNRFSISKSTLQNFTCFTALEAAKTSGLVLTDNLIASNGNHYLSRWADGITIHDAVEARIENNTFINNTDVQLIFGGCQNCKIDHNSFLHTDAADGGSFADLMLHAWPHSSSGDFTGTIISDNSIDCGNLKNCGFALMVGPAPWYQAPTFGGTVENNVIKNAMIGLMVDNVSGSMAFQNNKVSSSGGIFVTNCGLRKAPPINVAPTSRPFVDVAAIEADTHTAVAADEYMGCILNHAVHVSPISGINQELIDIYAQILWRAPDPSGAAFFQRRLQQGESITSIRSDIAVSAESTGNIRSLYLTITQRDPTDTELQAAQQSLADGKSLDELRILIGQSHLP